MRISRDKPFTSSRDAFSLISPGAEVLFNGVILSPLVYILVFCAAFVGSGLKAVGGFGFATLTTPTVAIFWDVPTAIAVISIPTLCTSLMNAWRTRAAVQEGLRPFIPFFSMSLVGLGVGLTILLNTDPRLMKFILGAFLIGQIVWQWMQPEKSAPEDSLKRSLGMGAVAGLMLGTINIPSHVIASYLTGMKISKERYLFVLSASQVVLRVAAIASIAAAGYIDSTALWLILVLTAPVLLGFFVGTKIYHIFTDQLFFRIVTAVLFIMGVLLLVMNFEALAAFF